MKHKLLNILLIVTSLFGYLEWGSHESSFLIEAEYNVIRGLLTDYASAAHPFTLIPLWGQIMLMITLFQKTPSRNLTYIGTGGIGLLLIFMLIVGLVSMNFRIAISTIPFLITAFFVIRLMRKKRRLERSSTIN